MSDFEYWKNEIADMPTQAEDGQWYDMETGLPFNPDANYRPMPTKKPKARKKLPDNAKKDREAAKAYGGKALRGTQKQKIWGEQIRASIISSNKLTTEQLENLMTCGGFTEHAKFWIENREVAPEKFTAENIVASWKGLKELEDKYYNELNRSRFNHLKADAVQELKDYLNACDFNFACDYVN